MTDEYATPFERAEAAAKRARAMQNDFGRLLSPGERIAAAWAEAQYEMDAALVEAVENAKTEDILNQAIHGVVERYDRRSTTGEGETTDLS